MLRKVNRGGVILATLLALAGCQSEKLVDDSGSQGGQVTLTASRGVSSRTHLGAPVNNSVPMYWTEGDQIYVSSKDGKTTGVLTLSSKAGAPTGTFTGFVFGDPKDLYYSVYPVPKDGKLDLSIIDGREIKTPMLGYIAKDDTGTDVAFSNTCGMAKVKLANAKGNLKFYAGKSDNGTIKDQLTLSSVATINVSGDEVSLKYNTTGKAANILVNNAQPIEGFLYIPYDLQSNKNASEVHFFIQGEEGELKQVSEEPVDLSQVDYGQVVQAVKEDLYTSGGEIVEATEKAVQNGELTLEQTENVVKTTVTENTVFKMPESIKNDEAVVVIEEISENATITIQSENAQNESDIENASQISEMTVILPSGTTEAEATETLKVNMPNTSVTVQSEDGNVLNINNVVALTGDNTFIIKEGVVIESLVAMKGAIEVSGNVKAITRGEGHHYGNNKVKVRVKKGGKAPKNLDSSIFEVVDENEGEVVPPAVKPEDGPRKVSTMAQLMSAINDGVAEIVLTKTVSLIDDTSLNLNDKVLTLSEDFVWDGNAAIKSEGHALTINGVIEGCQKTVSDKYLIDVKNASNVGLTNATLITNGVGNAVNLKDTKFSMDDSSISALNGYAVNVVAETNAVHVYLGTETGVGIKGNIGFCNNYTSTGSRLEVGEHSSIVGKLVTSGSNLKGLIINVKSGADVDENLGWPAQQIGTPVASFDDLQKALSDNTVTDILITKPISLSQSIDLKDKIIRISNTFFDDNKAEAAIVVENSNYVVIEGTKSSAKIMGSANRSDRYIIKINCNVNFNGVIIEAQNSLSALCVHDAILNTGNITNIKSVNGYALDMIAEQSCADAFLRDKTVVSGNVRYLLNSNKKSSFEVNNSSIQGDFTYGGNMGLKMLTITQTSEGTIEGKNWPSSDVVETVEVADVEQLTNALNISTVKNIILIEPLILDGALDLRGKTLSLSEAFYFGDNDAAITFVGANSEGSYTIENGTFTGNSSEQDKYLIKASNNNLDVNGVKLIANGQLNGIHVTADYCGLVYGASIKVGEGHHAIKMCDNGNYFKISILDNVMVEGDILVEANSDGLIKLDSQAQGQQGKVNGDIIISGSQAETVEVSEAVEGLHVGKIQRIPSGDTASGKDFENGGEF